MYMDSDAAGVDLRLAQAYLPICSGSALLVVVLVFMQSGAVGAAHRWPVVMLALLVLRRVKRERIFDSSFLLLNIVWSGLLHDFRETHATMQLWPGVLTVLWVCLFVCSNLSLMPWQTDFTQQPGAHNVLWVCHGMGLLASLYIAPDASNPAAPFVQAVLFFVTSVVWLYLMQTRLLSYDVLHSCQACQLRFSALLLVPLTVSVFLSSVVLLACISQNMGHALPVPSSVEDGKKDDDVQSVDDSEIFRLAMSSKASNP
eukprot:109013-Rhodomonas_salina.2